MAFARAMCFDVGLRCQNQAARKTLIGPGLAASWLGLGWGSGADALPLEAVPATWPNSSARGPNRLGFTEPAKKNG